MPMLPTFSLDACTPEPMPSKPAKIDMIPWTPMPRLTTLTGGSVRSTGIQIKTLTTLKH